MNRRIDPVTIFLLLAMVFMTMQRRLAGGQDLMDWIMSEVYLLPGIVIGLSFHEFGHAVVADKLGDPTAKNEGRVTINPMAHIDLLGFVCLFIAGFGWGRAVPVNSRNFKNPKRDGILVSLAGITMNLLLAILFTVVMKIWVSAMGYSTVGMTGAVQEIILDAIVINVVLLAFNLIPIPPLDGFMVITDLFDLQKYDWWHILYSNGSMILLVMILLDVTDIIMGPVVNGLLTLLLSFV